MAGKETVYSSADNSGVVYAKCIGLPLRLNSQWHPTLSSLVRVMPKILNPKKPIKKKKLLGLVISLKKITKRPQGVWIRFHKNRILCLNDSFKFLGTRVKGPICREIRHKNLKTRYKKIISYSKKNI